MYIRVCKGSWIIPWGSVNGVHVRIVCSVKEVTSFCGTQQILVSCKYCMHSMELSQLMGMVHCM